MRTNPLVLAFVAWSCHSFRLQVPSEQEEAAASDKLAASKVASKKVAFSCALELLATVLLEFNPRSAVPHFVDHNPRISRVEHPLSVRMSDEDAPEVPKFTRIPIPVGPLCPVRSSYTGDSSFLMEGMDNLQGFDMTSFGIEMNRIGLQMQAGEEVDKGKVGELADKLMKAEETWRIMLTRMRMASDFQALEFFKVTEAWSKRNGQDVEMVGKMMKWQADNMKAFANDLPPTPPPPDIDMSKVMQPGGTGVNPMDVASAITASPLLEDSEILKSEVIQQELKQLSEDHSQLIKMGEMYGDFDPAGKIIFIDKIEEIESRWDTFYSRFALLGVINPEFERQSTEYFNTLGMSNDQFRVVLAEAHDIMRRDADPLYGRSPANLGGFF